MSKNKKLLIRIIVSAAIYIVAIILNHFFELEEIVDLFKYNLFTVPKVITLVAFLASYLILAYSVIYKSFRNVSHGKLLDENFLMLIASVGAFAIGNYIESVAVMIFYQVGELFESYAVGKSRTSISNLMDIRPEIAHKVLEDGTTIDLDPTEVAINDVIMVMVGEKIPLDGVVVSGATSLDTSALTGESMPKDVNVNDMVESGTINKGAVIKIRVTTTFENSTVAKILELVENASNKKTKAESFISVFAKYYTPIVVGLAVVITVIPSIITHDFVTWFYRSLNFLVVSCPCALVISVPLSFFGGIGGASKEGILVKGSNYFEVLNKANIFVFDKTGTLTKGNFIVKEAKSYTNDEELNLAAYLAEKDSTHPIARSIISHIGNIEVDTSTLEVEEISGKGMLAKYNGTVYLAGNTKLMDAYNIEYPNVDAIGTIIHVATTEKYLGYFVICDEIKPESKSLISKLNSKGYQTIMLTGDNEKVAKAVSEELGLTKYYAGLLPTDKVNILEQIIENKNKNDVVAYLGDGINDAPVLMRADVGISMGQLGSDSAIEASDIVLMFDRLMDILTAKQIARKTMRIVKENIIFALSVKILVMIYSIVVPNPMMWLAIFADVGVSVIAICNSMRAMKVNHKHTI